jgi:exopolyphosphatase / guanosine-5'-triphosphate,3'-diphosphate pyrophosphatase
LVVDAHAGAPPVPAHSYKTELRLAELLDSHGRIGAAGANRLIEFVTDALAQAEDKGVEEMLAFATSAIRDAPNGDEVLAKLRSRSGVDLQVLSGDDEARLTFLAARRWYGWSSGRLLVLDIGGGSLEVATGSDEQPDAAISLPLGAGRLTRELLPHDPPKPDEVKALRKSVRAAFARDLGLVTRAGVPGGAVGTSKTFRSLARLAGAAPSGDGPYVRRILRHDSLLAWLPRLAEASASQRAQFPGVSPGRSRQLYAGAVVADAAMDLLGLDHLEICPWALREGVILRRLDQLD